MDTKHIDVQGYRVTVSRRWYWGSIGIRLRYNELTIHLKGIDLPEAILSASDITTFANHAAIPDRYYKNADKLWKAQFRLSRFYLKFPMHLIGGLRVYTPEEHLSFYASAVAGLPQLKKVLSGRNASFPSIIMAKGDRISFYKDGTFLQGIIGRLYLPEKQASEIAGTLVELAERIRRQPIF